MSDSMLRWGARTVVPGVETPKPAQAWATTLMAYFETDPDLVAAVLPLPLEPDTSPLVRVSISRVEMDSGYRFGAGGFAVAARHGEVQGFYPLTMPMGTEAAVIGGREVYGEPKKLAAVELCQDGEQYTATVARNGVCYMELRATRGEALPGPTREDSLDFYYKFLVAPDFSGFDADPNLVYCRRETAIRNQYRMRGELILRESEYDPVADFPVRSEVSITLSERQAVQRGELVQQVPGEWVAPFAHQRYDQFAWA